MQSDFPWCDRSIADLPILPLLPAMVQALANGDDLVLEAAPGAGKTTTVPLALLNESWLAGKKILMLEPRRMAARAAAVRMAHLLGESVGVTVGYRVRQDSQVSQQTRIEVITDGIFTRMLQSDPGLEDVGLVIFDEFHERSLDTDLGLTLCLQARDYFRQAPQPLKLLVMSATLQGIAIETLLGHCPKLVSEGRQYPVEIEYVGKSSLTMPTATDVARVVRRALQQEPGSALVFLPGQKEIHQVAQALADLPSDQFVVAPLYGALPFAAQQQAIVAAPAGQRKIVLSTDIAESSLTIDGVRIVVDCGWRRSAVYDSAKGMTRLQSIRISQASATQRCGRAGRLEPGKCFRLWSREQQAQLPHQTAPEIVQADLAPLALQLILWGVNEPSELSWLDGPPPVNYQRALTLLVQLDAITQTSFGVWQLTAAGEAMAELPAHPRLAHMLVAGAKANVVIQAAGLAAILSDNSPRHASDDLARLYQQLFDADHHRSSQQTVNNCVQANTSLAKSAWGRRVQQQAHRFVDQLRALNLKSSGEPLADYACLAFVLACAYPDRIARQVHGDRYQLSGGRQACLGESSDLSQLPWLVVGELGSFNQQASDRIFAALPFDCDLLQGPLAYLLRENTVMQWDKARARFVAEKRQMLGAVCVAAHPLTDVPESLRQQALLEYVRSRGLAFLPWTDGLQQWLARVQLLRRIEGDEWPDVSREALLAQLDDWLAPFLTQVVKLSDFNKVDVSAALQTLLDWSMQQRLNALAPVSYVVPSGASIAIDYGQSPPVLAVKLQEMFGCEQTPCIVNGKVPLMVHLLSPARRPLQITQDLAGFWRGSYHDVKKDMKGRYPKHPWPDDPTCAQATRFTKRRPVK